MQALLAPCSISENTTPLHSFEHSVLADIAAKLLFCLNNSYIYGLDIYSQLCLVIELDT